MYARATSGIRFQFFVENVQFVGGKLRSTVHGPYRKDKRQDFCSKIGSKFNYDWPLVNYDRPIIIWKIRLSAKHL